MKEKNKKIENQMISKLTSRQLLWITKKTKHYKLYDLVNQKVKLEVDMYYSLRITLYKLQSWVKYQI